MRKLLLLIISIFVAFGSSEAQNYQDISKIKGFFTNQTKDNWFISVGGGVQVYGGTEDLEYISAYNISPSADLSFGHWMLPSLGFRVQLSGVQAYGWSSTLEAPYADPTAVGGLYQEKFFYGGASVDFLWNILEMGERYKTSRIFRLYPYIGAGIVGSFKPGLDSIPIPLSPSAKAGLIFNFKLSQVVSLNMELRSTMHSGNVDLRYGSNIGPMIEFSGSATVGVQFDINYKKYERRYEMEGAYIYELNGHKAALNQLRKDYALQESKIKDLNLKYYEMMKENDQLIAQLNKNKNQNNSKTIVRTVRDTVYMDREPDSQAAEKIITKNFAGVYAPIVIPDLAIFFNANSFSLSEKDRVNLRYYAKIIKESGLKFQITVYNEFLPSSAVKTSDYYTDKRGASVYEYLTRRCGVEKEKLTIIKGRKSDVPFSEASLNRVAIISPVVSSF